MNGFLTSNQENSKGAIMDNVIASLFKIYFFNYNKLCNNDEVANQLFQ